MPCRMFAVLVLKILTPIVFLPIWLWILSNLFMINFPRGHAPPGSGLVILCCAIPLTILSSSLFVTLLISLSKNSKKEKRKNSLS